MLDKLLKRVFYFFSGFSIRDKKKWVFASHTTFGDNSRYLFEEEYNPNNTRRIWIAKSEKEYLIVKSFGHECYRKNTIKAIFHSLTSKYFIYTCYVSEVGFQYSRNAVCINLWHGLPIKKIEFDIKSGRLSKKFNNSITSKIKHPEIYKKPDFLLCPSQFVYNYSFKNAFKINIDNILFFPYPRTINLKNTKKNKNDFFIFLYAPTWRDTSHNFLNDIKPHMDLLNLFCIRTKSLLVVRLHNNSNINTQDYSYSNIFFEESSVETNFSLSQADCLITDYSSIFFDYLVLNRPILFFVFDEKQYITRSRETYRELDEIEFGHKVYNINNLVEKMNFIRYGNDDMINQRKQAMVKFNIEFLDSNNKRLIDAITRL